MGAEVVYNHADYRLVSSLVLQEFSDFQEVNLFLRGLFPLVGFKSTCVYYCRHKRRPRFIVSGTTWEGDLGGDRYCSGFGQACIT